MGFMTLFKGKKILEPEIEERFDLGKKLGEGNFAAVFSGRDRKTGVEYAIKIISRSRVKDKEYMVKSELDVLKQMSHPHIITLVDVIETKKNIYVVTEMATGGDLFANVQAAGRLSEAEAKGYARQILKALDYMHVQNIVHRDIKPENILLNNPKDKEIMLIDFGLAVVMKDGRLLREACGSPEYVAPEVLRPQHHGYGTKADLWSVGVVTYIMLCGYHPFAANSEEDRSYLIRNGVFEFHEERWGSVSSEAKDFIKKLIEIDYAERLDAKGALDHPWLRLSSEQEAREKKHEQEELLHKEKEKQEREAREKQREEARKAEELQKQKEREERVKEMEAQGKILRQESAAAAAAASAAAAAAAAAAATPAPAAAPVVPEPEDDEPDILDQLLELDSLAAQSEAISVDAVKLEQVEKEKIKKQQEEDSRRKEEEIRRREREQQALKQAEETERKKEQEKEDKRKQQAEEKKQKEIDAAFNELEDTLKGL